MRVRSFGLVLAGAALLGGCSLFNPSVARRTRPDEFQVARNPPLVIPPEFNLTPPRAGEPESTSSDPRSQALQALFGGPAPRSEVEQRVLQQADANDAALGARSVAGDPQTAVVNRGQLVQTMLQLPQGDGQEAAVQMPQ